METFGRETVHFIITGGTIDDVDLSVLREKLIDKLKKEPALHTKIPSLLKQGGVSRPVYLRSAVHT